MHQYPAPPDDPELAHADLQAAEARARYLRAQRQQQQSVTHQSMPATHPQSQMQVAQSAPQPEPNPKPKQQKAPAEPQASHGLLWMMILVFLAGSAVGVSCERNFIHPAMSLR